MADVYIDHLSFALGDTARSVDQAVADKVTLSNAAVLREAGFQKHHVCKPGTTAYDLARRAVEPIRAKLGDIGAIIYATCVPVNGNVGSEATFRETRDIKHLMDFPASHLQADFGLDRAIVVGLNQQACTGLLGSLRMAQALLRSEPELKRALCLTADRFPDGALYEQSYNLISDGAAACVASLEPAGYRLVACHGITNGALSQATDDETVGTYFSFTHRLIQELLAKAKLAIGDIDWIVPQNTNIKAWQILSRLLPVPMERVYFESLGEAAHLISGDNIVNLKQLDDAKRIRPGQRALLVMAGYGLNWQGVILEKR